MRGRWIIVISFLLALIGLLSVNCQQGRITSKPCVPILGDQERNKQNNVREVRYISMACEVVSNLKRCYQKVADYFEKTHINPDGTEFSNILPLTMDAPVCPKGINLKANVQSQRYAEEGHTLCQIGILITDNSNACYQYTTSAKDGKPVNGDNFTCHAWTDFDGDGKFAHWTKKATFIEDVQFFRFDEIEKDNDYDDW